MNAPDPLSVWGIFPNLPPVVYHQTRIAKRVLPPDRIPGDPSEQHANTRYMAGLRGRREAAGQCIACGSPRDNETQRCTPCRERARKYTASWKKRERESDK